MTIYLPLALLVVPILFGCAVGGVAPSVTMPLKKCADDGEVDCIISDTAGKDSATQQISEVRPTDKELPSIGLAMSGGGSKAAPFAMGVLKRFVEENQESEVSETPEAVVLSRKPWIFKTEYLSTVSGSGYSALYLYYKAYKMVSDNLPLEEYGVSGLQRFFVDSHLSPAKQPYNVEIRSMNAGDATVVNSLPDMPDEACYRLTVPSYAPFSGRYEPTEIRKGLKNAVYQGWVECYQDILLSTRSVNSAEDRDTGRLARTFGSMFAESLMAAPVHYFSNLVFDWRKRLSPTQYDYLYGIVRTYAYVPQEGSILPTGSRDQEFDKTVNCLRFRDLADIYTKSESEINARVGGYLPKWILQATGASGNVGLDFTRAPYNLPTDVFEITFDGFGSGRYHYVRGSPDLVGLTVPLALLSSAAFADTAQRSLRFSRASVNAVLQGLDLRWGFDIANYNTSNADRVKHSLLIWPFYFYDDPVTSEEGPTIHLSDGGQTGDNLGMVSLLRRSVRNIIVANGENDWHRDSKTDGYMSLSSLCSVNYYLIQHGYKLVFNGDPRSKDDALEFDLSVKCQWDDEHRSIFVHPKDPSKNDDKKASPLEDQENITPFNWRKRVWTGEVRKLGESDEATRILTLLQTSDVAPPLPDEVAPQKLDGIKVYYMMAALDKDEWLAVAHRLYDRKGTDGSIRGCKGLYPSENHAAYPCGLIEYIHDTIIEPSSEPGKPPPTKEERIKAEKTTKWVFPQNSTAFTTYSNSVQLFRAYRDLGWAYADSLKDILQELKQNQPNKQPIGYETLYAKESVPDAPSLECQNARAEKVDRSMIQRN